jgi:predicted transcriptional regulator
MKTNKTNKKRKTTMTFTIDRDILEKFKEISERNGINKSKLLENFIVDFIEKIEKQKLF